MVLGEIFVQRLRRKFAINSTNWSGKNSNSSKRSRARGESDAKIGLVVTLLTLTARLEGNKRSNDGCTEEALWMVDSSIL